MSSELNSAADVAEAYEHLAFNHKLKPRLKNALNLQQLVTEMSTTFEVDETSADALVLEADDDVFGYDMDSLLLMMKEQEAVFKDAASFESVVSVDSISMPFQEVLKSMTSIHDKQWIMKEVIRTGTGKLVPENCKVFVHYVITTEGANEPFDSTVARKAPAILDMRHGDMLPGLFLAIESMKLSELSKFIIKSELAFGQGGCPPRIPAGADILCIVEILQIIDEKQLDSPLYMTAEQRSLLPFHEILDFAEVLRTEGNGHYSDGIYMTAIRKYRKAVNSLEEYPVIGSTDEDKRCALLHTLYANLAQCYIKMDRPAQACTACKIGMRSAQGKDNVKLLFRFAKAKLLLKDCDAAVKLCDNALKFDPRNADVLTLKGQAILEQNKQTVASEQMYKNMFK